MERQNDKPKNVSDEQVMLVMNTWTSNSDTPIKTNNKVSGQFKHDFGSKEIEEFIVLKPMTDSIRNGKAKKKGIKKENNCKHEDYYNAQMKKKNEF